MLKMSRKYMNIAFTTVFLFAFVLVVACNEAEEEGNRCSSG